MADKKVFDELYAINVNDNTESKNGLTYLSWAWAWAETKKNCPNASYKILRDENGLPYFKEDGVGYMCMTEVTIDGETLMMWLPVMDYRNKAMMQPTMFDINKTIMRCLTKNLAMFGLGLYIYAGEDLPESEAEAKAREEESDLDRESLEIIDAKKAAALKKIIEETGTDTKKMLAWVNKKYGRNVNSVDELNNREWSDVSVLVGNKKGAK